MSCTREIIADSLFFVRRLRVLGVFDSNVLRLLFSGSVKPTDLVVKAMNKNYRQVSF